MISSGVWYKSDQIDYEIEDLLLQSAIKLFIVTLVYVSCLYKGMQFIKESL